MQMSVMANEHMSSGQITLSGLRVVERQENLAAAFCGKYLAALGAEVIVEQADRFADLPSAVLADGRNVLGLYLDRGKTLGSSSQGDDVVLGADLSTPRDPAHPGQIRVGFTDFGGVGPRAWWKSSEFVTQAATGMMSIVGELGGPPLALGGHQIDYSVGLTAFTAVMIALWERDATTGSGEGQDIAVSRYETGAYIEWKGRTYGQLGSRLGRGDTSGPLVVKVKDGYFGLFYDDQKYLVLADKLGDPRLLDARFANRGARRTNEQALLEIFNDILRDRTREELYVLGQAMDMAVAPVLTVGDLLQSPQYLHRGFIISNPAAGNHAREPGMPVTFNLVRPGAVSSEGHTQND